MLSCADSFDDKKQCKTITDKKREKQISERNAICSMDSRVNLSQLDSSSCIFLENKGFEVHEVASKEKTGIFGYVTASFTVEASLIMITVIMAIFLCIYYGFILHDKTILEEASWQAAQKAVLSVTENSNMENGVFDWEELQKKGLLWRLSQNSVVDPQIVSTYMEKRITGELFACDEPVIQVVSKAGSVRIFYQAQIRLPLFSAMRLFGVPSSLSGSVQVKESKQEEFIRLVRGIMKDKEEKEDQDG